MDNQDMEFDAYFIIVNGGRLIIGEEGEGNESDGEYEAEVAAYLSPTRTRERYQSIHSDRSENLCVICMASQIEITLRPCGHRCLCEHC